MTKKKVWVPEYKHETLKGTFVDYRGVERDFTMVAVSVPVDSELYCIEGIDDYWEYDYENECEYLVETPIKKDILMTKMLTVGVSVRCSRDEDNGLGERIAYGKALKYLDHALFVSHPGMINTKMVRALLEQEAEHFKKDPGSYLKGYNNDKMRYEKTGIIADAEKLRSEVYGENCDKRAGVTVAVDNNTYGAGGVFQNNMFNDNNKWCSLCEDREV